MLTLTGKKRGVAAVVRELDAWHQKNLSKYKWLRGGIEVVDHVCFFPSKPFFFSSLDPFFFASLSILSDSVVIAF